MKTGLQVRRTISTHRNTHSLSKCHCSIPYNVIAKHDLDKDLVLHLFDAAIKRFALCTRLLMQLREPIE